MTFAATPPPSGRRSGRRLDQQVHRQLSRRGLVAAAPTLALVAGCEWGPDVASSSGASPQATAPPAAADRDLVDQAVAAISSTHAVASDGAGRKALRIQLLALHQAHLEHLGEAMPSASPGLPPPTRANGWRVVQRAERELQDTLIGLAQAAESGTLARTLGSMAAGIAQLLATSTPEPTDG